MSLLLKMAAVFAEEGAEPLLAVGVRADGVFRMAINPAIRKLLQDEDSTFYQDVVQAIAEGLKEMGHKPLDDMEIR